MNNRNKHIKQRSFEPMRSFTKMALVLCVFVFLFLSSSLQAQVISNNGAGISVTNGTFVNTDSIKNTVGKITNNGIIDLRGSYINEDTTMGNGVFNIAGNWINTNIFIPGISTVRFNGTNFQSITSTGGETFYHLIINNSGAASVNRITLLDNVNISGSLTLDSGNVVTGLDTLNLINPLTTSLNYISTTNSRVIGKFERGVNALTSNYLFPIGSDENYNPMNLNFNAITNPGSVLSEFIASDPDSIGLPLPDPGYVIPADTVEVYNADSIGYWSVTANNSFASDDFDVNLSGSGFTTVQNASRIIKRPTGGDWMLDGNHKDGVDSVAYRNELTAGIDNSNGNEFGWGHIRPRIQSQPKDTAVCDGFSASFSVEATGRGGLTYEWEVWELTGVWQPVSDDATYANSNTDTLLIKAADLSMDGFKYRVIVSDSLGNFHRSNSQATLTVNPNPIVLATPRMDTICNGSTTFIDLNSDVPGTTYFVEVINWATTTILGADGTLTNDTTIQQLLTNSTLFADSVVYVITPTGPGSTVCIGTNDTVVIWVEPTVNISALNDTICNGDQTNIVVLTDNVTTNGIYYTWTTYASDPDVSGYTNNATGQDISVDLIETLDNIGLDSAIVHYNITPWTLDASGELKCQSLPILIDIWVEPTVVITALSDTLCDGDTTNIMVASTNVTTNGIRYTWTVADNLNITGESNSTGNGQVNGTAIEQKLINTSFNKQKLQYVITPWTVNASNENECTDLGERITIDIWIDPTPRVFSEIFDDTICNDTRTHITLTTPNILTVGQVTFDYISLADGGLTGNSNLISDRFNGFIIEDSLHNSTAAPASPQVVRYTITPRALQTGCSDGPSITDSITVHPTADTYMYSDSVICYLESNGIATVVAENGVGIFSYQWDDPSSQTNAIATGLVEGFYTVTVTDNQSCTKTDTVTVEQPFILVPVIDTVKNVSCFGAGNGYIVLDPTGGNGSYSYLWSTGEITDSIFGLDGGLFYATVTDWKGCTKNTSMIVGEPPQISIDVFPHHVSCNGETDGWAIVDAIGLNLYEWSTGATTQVISNLTSGQYTVTASNAEGCYSVQETEILEPDSLLVDSIITTRISCAGDADGTIKLFVSGGNIEIPYTYNWLTLDGIGIVPEDSASQTGLSGGTYYVTINDWRGCEVSDTAYINEPPIYFSNILATDIECNGDADGEIYLTVEGGNTETDYAYNWFTSDGEGLVIDSEDQTGLSGGSYYVTVTDAKNCELYDTAIIMEPDMLIALISETNLTCHAYDNGTANVDIAGGTGAYEIIWSNGAMVDSIFDLSASTYYVTVTDDNNCSVINYVEITQPDQIETNLSTKNISCFGYSNGEIMLSPEGGTLPYSYSWSHSTLFADRFANNLEAGEYSISVIDGNNCMEINTITITQPDPLVFDEFNKEDISCYGETDGSIVFEPFGGTPEYTYTWSNGYAETLAYYLSKGSYNIKISDIHNCEIDTTVEISEPEKLIINPVYRKPTCPDIQDGYIELNISGGRSPYDVYWDNGSFEEDLYEIRSGIYDVLINDSSLCEVDTSFIVRSAHDFCIDIPSAFSPNDDNINEKWEIDMGGLYPNVEIEIFDRSGKRIFFSKGYEESQYWDGTYNGKALPMDAYYYIIYLKNGSERISGTITILR